MSDVAIRVFDLGKQYRIGGTRAPYKTFREAMMGALSSPLRVFSQNGHGNKDTNTFWALKDVNFEIKRGEVVGVIGRNGAGKSTLLKILSRITEPTEGGADIYGRVGSLLEVGTGFHPELTGRENIVLSGAILGMKRAEIEKKFDEIVAFAEVEKFIDTPVKHYSSGMYLRLAFAVAAHLEPEILLVDEVLAVGDAAFQKKCLGKMSDVAREGRTVLFVSHNMGAILQLCSRSMFFDQGICVHDGETDLIVAEYLHATTTRESAIRYEAEASKSVQIIAMQILNEEGDPLSTIPHTLPFVVEIEYIIKDWPKDSYLCLDVFNQNETRLLWSSDTNNTEGMTLVRKAGFYKAYVKIPGMILAPGRYYFTSSIYAPGHSQLHETRDKAISVEVSDGGSFLSNFGIRPHAATMIPLCWQTETIAH